MEDTNFMFITIFTPSYNRGYTLHNLYNSLCKQKFKDFEWVIVDDGSTDNTKELVDLWKKENKVSIRYIYQKNSGKPAAHNKGVKEGRGMLFTCVDSDDYLTDDALQLIYDIWSKENKQTRIGILAYKINRYGKNITKLTKNNLVEATLHDAYRKYGLKGDTMLIYRSEVIKKYTFPIIDGEKFIPEGYLYNQLDKEGPMYIYRKGIYVCEYLPDGYTKNVAKLLYENYKGYILHINQRLKESTSFKDKVMDTIRYIAILIAHKENNIIKDAVYPAIALLAYIPAYIFHIKRYKFK